jgi:hypothetical protein
MPFPNEHACRIRDPGDFEPKSFRRIKQGRLGVIIARPTGKDTTATQAYRYPTKDWPKEEARKHCQKAGGQFEAAAEPKGEGS